MNLRNYLRLFRSSCRVPRSNRTFMISTYKKLGLLFVTTLSVALMAGCNDNLRQFIVPVPKPTGDPGAFSHAVVLATNPVAGANGITMHIDVSGDSNAGQVNTGPNPVFLGKAGSRVFLINGDNTITSYIALSPTASAVNTVTQPGGVSGTIAGGTSSSGNFYATNSGTNDLSQISGFALAVTQTIPVGTNPVAIAGSAANSKIYVVNNGSNNVTVVSTTDNSVLKSIPVGSHPIWGVMADNGVQVFIVNQGDGTAANPGSVSVIDTNLDIVIPCSPGPSCNPTTGVISVGNAPATSFPNFAFYDDKIQRLYVSNTGENTVSVIKADGIDLGAVPQVLPGLLANIMVSSAPTSVVALSDSTRVYAALGGCPAGTNHTNITTNIGSCTGNQVSVIDVLGLRQIKTIPVGAGAVSIDAAADGSRVYVVGAQAGNVSIIRTSTDSVNTTFVAPQRDLSCTSSCPLQIPFMVR